MTQKIRYTAEGLFILVTAALLFVGRATVFFLLVPVLFCMGFELNEKKWHNRMCGEILSLAFSAAILWMFNDLMAVGKVVGTANVVSLMNYIIYLMIFLLFMGLTGKINYAVIIPEILLAFVGILNAVIKAIRRTPISAGDIFSIKTAMAVAGNYSMEFDKDFMLKVAAGIAILVAGNIMLFTYLYKQRTEKRDKTKPILLRLLSIGIACIYFIIAITTTWIVKAGGRNADYFTHETNGFAYNIYLQLKDMSIKEPQNYAKNILQELAEKYPSDKVIESSSYPNIIVIMNESFADLSVLGEVDTNQEVLPFLTTLHENTIKGNLYSSVYGGNTANSEYEFLTGGSIAYFSERVVPFQLYMNETRPSIISQMNQLGYATIFMHPYRAYSWNRPSVYSVLGIDRMYYEEDMPELEMIRSYGTDRSQNDYLIQYLNSVEDAPVFLYDVTVQNHGGYTGTITELEDKITIAQHEGSFPETENYLTLVHESDQALEELISYLQEYEEPTAVLFFGDHQPAIETSFIEMAEGKSLSDFTLKERQDMYTVPFFLWTNYDIEEKQIDKISINYLSTFLCQELGIPMTGFQKYLADLYEEFPVINSVCVIDQENHYIGKDELEEEQRERYLTHIMN